MGIEKSFSLEIIEYNKSQIMRDGKQIKYKFRLGDEEHSASSDDFHREFTQALLKHPHEKIEVPKLDEKIYGRRFIHQVNTTIKLHNHLF